MRKFMKIDLQNGSLVRFCVSHRKFVLLRIVVLLHISSSIWYAPSRPSLASQVTKTQRSPTCHCLSMYKTTLRSEITFLLELPDLLGARAVGISLLHDLEKQPRCLNPNINGCLWTFSTCTLPWNQQNRRLTAENWVPSTQNTHISEVVAAHHMLPSDGRLSGSNAMSGKTSTISCTSSCHWHDGLKFDWVSGPTWGQSFYTCRWGGLKLSQHKQMTL